MSADHLKEAQMIVDAMLSEARDGLAIAPWAIEQLRDFLALAEIERQLPSKPTGE
jgi:hypothetical protein